MQTGKVMGGFSSFFSLFCKDNKKTLFFFLIDLMIVVLKRTLFLRREFKRSLLVEKFDALCVV